MFKSTLLFYVLFAAPVVSSLLSPLSLILHCATKTQYYTVNTQLCSCSLATTQTEPTPDWFTHNKIRQFLGICDHLKSIER